ncbi:MAG: hypothetical protein ACRD4B_05615 [Acidobacteriota bacterium]
MVPINKQRVMIFTFIFLSVHAGGCLSRTVEEIRSRPTIAGNHEWWVEEGCGFARCGGWPVDFLHTRGVKIRIESLIYVPPPIFLIKALFILEKDMLIEIDPSLTRVVLPDKRIVQAKGYYCSGKIFDKNSQIHIPPIRSTIVISSDGVHDCLFFVFDAPAPKVNEQYKFIIRGATLNGRPLDIPEITFRPVLTRY